VGNRHRNHDAQVAQIAASIAEFGFNHPILVDTKAGIIAGHGHLPAARKLQLQEVPVIKSWWASRRKPRRGSMIWSQVRTRIVRREITVGANWSGPQRKRRRAEGNNEVTNLRRRLQKLELHRLEDPLDAQPDGYSKRLLIERIEAIARVFKQRETAASMWRPLMLDRSRNGRATGSKDVRSERNSMPSSNFVRRLEPLEAELAPPSDEPALTIVVTCAGKADEIIEVCGSEPNGPATTTVAGERWTRSLTTCPALRDAPSAEGEPNANPGNSTCTRTLGANGQLTEIVRLDGKSDDLTDEDLDRFIAGEAMRTIARRVSRLEERFAPRGDEEGRKCCCPPLLPETSSGRPASRGLVMELAQGRRSRPRPALEPSWEPRIAAAEVVEGSFGRSVHHCPAEADRASLLYSHHILLEPVILSL
jgi:hypothetical protein